MRDCRAVFASDFHLGKLLRFWPNHLERQYHALRQPFTYALANGIRNVIIGGDISEDPFLSGPALTVLFRLLNEFDGLLEIHIILGNHDFADVSENSLQPLIELCRRGRLKGKKINGGGKYKTVYVYDKPTHVIIDGVNFNMLPFPYGSKDKPYKGVSVNVAHLEWEGAVRDNGKSKIRGGYNTTDKGDFWLIGHLHTAQYLKLHRVLYCGTLFQTNFGESLDKSFCDCTFRMVKGELRAKFDRIPSKPGFSLRNVTINSRADLAKLSKNPDIQYKLRVVEGVEVPRDLQLEYTNIRGISGLDDMVGLEESGDPNIPSMNSSVSVTAGLNKFLKNQGLDKPQRKRGLLIMRELTGA